MTVPNYCWSGAVWRWDLPTSSSTFAAAPQNLCVALAARSDHKPASVGIFLRIPVNVKVF
jgi:hypothetical protein